ncbi:tetratricopeptide repeat protein [Pedobacter sp. PWIIR3]
MRKLFILLLLLPFVCAASENSAAIFNDANTAYTKGQYELALKRYQQLLDSGFNSKEVYYNLGNANYKLNNFAPAILNYEKAYKLAPGDEDIQMNLRLANLKITDKIEAVPEFFLKKWWIGFITSFSLQLWSALGVMFFLLGFALMIVYLFSLQLAVKRTSFYSGLTLILVGLICLGIASAQDNYFEQHKEAIVFNGVVNVKSAPNEKQKTLFIVHEGTKVRITDSRSEWVKIELPNGNVGWMEELALKKI